MFVDSFHWLTQLTKNGSITRTSEELQISQQTLSSRVASLERELGCKLFVRSTPLTLTKAGEVFFEFAEEYEALRTQMLRKISEASSEGTGVIKIGVSNIRAQVLMPKVMEKFHEVLPQMSIKQLEGTNEELLHLAERNEADLVIARFDESRPGVEFFPLFQEEVVCVIKPELLSEVTGLPIDQARAQAEDQGLKALKKCPFLLESINDISGRVARSELRKAKIRPTIALESDNMMTMLSLCKAGLGAIFCPTNVLDATPFMSKDLVRINLSESACYTIGIGLPPDSKDWQPAITFAKVANSMLGNIHDEIAQ